MLFDFGDTIAGVVGRLPPVGGGEDQLGASIGRIGASLEVTQPFQLTDGLRGGGQAQLRPPLVGFVSRMPLTPTLPKMCKWGSRRSAQPRSPAGEKSSVRNYRSNRSLTSRRSAAMSIEGNRESLNLEETQRVGPKPRAAKLSPHAGSNCFRRLSAPSPLSCGNVASRPVSNTRTAAIGP